MLHKAEVPWRACCRVARSPSCSAAPWRSAARPAAAAAAVPRPVPSEYRLTVWVRGLGFLRWYWWLAQRCGLFERPAWVLGASAAAGCCAGMLGVGKTMAGVVSLAHSLVYL